MDYYVVVMGEAHPYQDKGVWEASVMFETEEEANNRASEFVESCTPSHYAPHSKEAVGEFGAFALVFHGKWGDILPTTETLAYSTERPICSLYEQVHRP